MSNKFLFLTSTRFWAMVIGAVTVYLKSSGYIGEAEAILVQTLVIGFIGVRTVDRFAERIG